MLRALFVLMLRRQDVTRRVAVVAVQQFAVGYLLQHLFIGLLCGCFFLLNDSALPMVMSRRWLSSCRGGNGCDYSESGFNVNKN